MRTGKGQGHEAPARVPEQMEALETLGVGESRQSVDLHLDRVTRGRLRSRIDLEVFQMELHVGTERFDQRRVALRGRHHTTGQSDHMGGIASHAASTSPSRIDLIRSNEAWFSRGAWRLRWRL